ncbi:MAG TPA: phytanoyl-CoA dioxygenase family protein [Anaerolineales bacterium]|nr:phytanoyl-CoA dioxygenase family protein [Anaerolineales bacterium]
MNDEQRKQLDEQGYLIFKGLLPPDQIELLRTKVEELWGTEGEKAGEENYIEPGVRRLANLANKGDIFREIYSHPQVLEVIEAVMGSEIRASMVNARDVPPHTGARMPFHMDSDKGRHRDEKGFSAATAIWMLDPFTVENGATAFVPGSHLIGKSPKQVLTDLNASHPDEIVLEGEAGDVLVFNGHCWHAGRPNLTEGHRRALLVHYLRADVPRPENRRQYLNRERAAELSSGERELLGLDDEPND